MDKKIIMFKIIVKIKKITNFKINQCLEIITKTGQLTKQKNQILKQLNYRNLLQEYKTTADSPKPPMILDFYDLKNK
jgi:hypothetical protein